MVLPKFQPRPIAPVISNPVRIRQGTLASKPDPSPTSKVESLVHNDKAATELERLLVLEVLATLDAREAEAELAADRLEGAVEAAAAEEIDGVELVGVLDEPPPLPPQDNMEKDIANNAIKLRMSIVVSRVKTLNWGCTPSK